jgi:hypothetical protein
VRLAVSWPSSSEREADREADGGGACRPTAETAALVKSLAARRRKWNCRPRGSRDMRAFTSFRIAGEEAHLPTMALALALGAAGGAFASVAGLPLPMLLGSLIAVSAAAIAGLRPTGRVLGRADADPQPRHPRHRRVDRHGRDTRRRRGGREMVAEHCWRSSSTSRSPTRSATVTRRIGGLDPATSFYGTMPGGFVEAIAMGDARGRRHGLSHDAAVPAPHPVHRAHPHRLQPLHRSGGRQFATACRHRRGRACADVATGRS